MAIFYEILNCTQDMKVTWISLVGIEVTGVFWYPTEDVLASTNMHVIV